MINPTTNRSNLRKKVPSIVSSLCVILLVTGCASTTNITNSQMLVTGQLPRPNHIFVYNFTASPNNISADKIAVGRQIGSEIAAELATNISNMGLPAAQASTGTQPQINDIVIQGQILSLVEGSAAERVAIGFGEGASELKVQVEGYQMTPRGLQKLGYGTTDAGGSTSPGAALGVAGAIATANPAGLIVSTGMKEYGEVSGSSTVEGRAKDTAKEIADRLRTRFQQQGWIQ